MYILIIASGYPKIKSPLNGIFEFDQARALTKNGHKIIFVSIDLRSLRRKRKLGKYWTKVEGIDIINVSIPLGRVPTKLLLFIGKLSLKMVYSEILKKHGTPDIIHAHFTHIANIATILKEKYHIPLVITEHSSQLNQVIVKKSVKDLASKTYGKSDKLITVSTALSEKIKTHINVESTIIHNIVDTSTFKYFPKKALNDFTFISVGNLNFNKGFDILINAFKKANFNNNVLLNIVGDGPLYTELKETINSLKLSNQVKLLGLLNRYNISKLMGDSNTFVLASRSETFGVVYIEALLTGLPVIATSCGGPEDFVNKQNGLLIPINDIDALTDALKYMYMRNSDYNSELISEQCRKEFSPETISSQLTQVYKNILNNK